MSVRIIKPCLLVAVRSTVRGGVQYLKEDLDFIQEDERTRKKWQTEKIVENQVEFDLATKIRNKAMAEIRRPCTQTSFGLICSVDCEDMLDDAHNEAKLLIQGFNEQAQYSRINISLVKGQVASSDQEAIQAVRDEVSELLESMNQAIVGLDPKAIREAATKAKDVAKVLDKEQGDKIMAAIDDARAAARVIVRRVQKSGEDAESVLAELKLDDLKKARFAFLDLVEHDAIDLNLPAASIQRFANVGDDAAEAIVVPVAARNIEVPEPTKRDLLTSSVDAETCELRTEWLMSDGSTKVEVD